MAQRSQEYGVTVSAAKLPADDDASIEIVLPIVA
jgi:hypothetical protein